MSHLKFFDRDFDNLRYLSVRREWYRRCSSDVQSSHHGGSSAEQSQTSRSSSSPFVDIDLENMTDSGSSNQPGRSPKNKKSAISKFFNRLSLSKKQQNELNTPLSEEPGTSEERSTTMTHVNSSYDSVAHSDLPSESYYAAPRNSPVTSRDVPPDQSLQAKQHHLLRRLHSTLNEATVIVKEFLVLYKRED
ncbi:ser-rich protein [Diolcogaster facetosa bracovirus]|uniref:Ser-rich protein n=1 Tax=Bracoviriform facetosae TaxID=2083300 RepID=R9XLM8_9VIRU|nr:ser-rich protein [Diolcogaster facetosa bracovirus] [Bracoviriform facetosae]YP_009665880.1 ser-rich protein [Diolcogaster facetosa bracovirus] [Bracoviriform facetosae]AGO14395.1 ser-rich protein [Diolcogaster facetosa bracovirus] [Bracoviriform facetosae]AGO14468.1 ser-rich protein [Diolcogaster facetosa bracovirus] [Bracoviriform facetosae]